MLRKSSRPGKVFTMVYFFVAIDFILRVSFSGFGLVDLWIWKFLCIESELLCSYIVPLVLTQWLLACSGHKGSVSDGSWKILCCLDSLHEFY